ncbi:MAG: OmpA family protein [Buchnera aphidicola (Meitanaphis flavogallis)]
MKLNKIFKILTLFLPIIAMFSCSFQKDKLNPIIADQNNPIIDTQEDSNIIKPFDDVQQDNTIYFGLNTSNVNAKFSKILNSTVTFLYNHPEASVVIEGHADKRGPKQYNIDLGKRRAEAVKLYLESKGIPSNQISTVSYGSEKPAKIGNTEDAYSKNRRAVIIYS